jgi:hypothetical protein
MSASNTNANTAKSLALFFIYFFSYCSKVLFLNSIDSRPSSAVWYPIPLPHLGTLRTAKGTNVYSKKHSSA